MRRLFVMLLSAHLAFAVPAFASDPEPSYRLGEVVVSDKINSVESVSSAYRITAAEIEETGARNLNEAIDHIPGLYVRVGNAGTPRIDIRGQRTRHVRLLLNGVPLNSTYDRQFDPTSIPVENIAEIKVTVGTGSVLYGPGGSAGVINIITKKGYGETRATLGGEMGTDDRYSAQATLSGAGEKVDGFFSASMDKRANMTLGDDFVPLAPKYEDGDDRENSDFERINLFTGFGYSPSENLDLGLTMGYTKGEEGTPHTIVGKDDFNGKPKFLRTEDLEAFSTQLAFGYNFDGPFEIRGWTYFNQNDETEVAYDSEDYDTITGTDDMSSQVYGVNLQLNYTPNETNRLGLAVMAEENTWDSSASDDVSGKDVQFYTMALEYNLQVCEKLDLVMGAGQHFMTKDEGDDEDDFSWMIGAGYDIVPGSRIKASISKNVTFPSIKQLYKKDEGETSLTAEQTYSYELGLEQMLPANNLLTVTGFIKDAKDFIEKKDDKYKNYEEYRFHGVEIGLTNTYFKHLTINTSYSFLDSEDNSADSDKDELQYRPGQKFYLEARYRFPFGLTATASLTHVADQYYYSKNEKIKEKLNDFTVVDVKISQKFMEDALEIYLRAENLLDEMYFQSYAVPADGRSVYIGAKYIF